MLPPDQIKELDLAIYNYLLNHNKNESAKHFAEESEHITENNLQNSEKNILERKWFTIIKLQSKIIELEKKLAFAEEQLSRGVRKITTNEKNIEKIIHPSLQLKHIFKGHRDTVNCVAFHLSEPIFASGCIDGSIRIYDYELNEQNALLRSHTHSVNCLKWHGNQLISGSSDMTLKIWKDSKNDSNINPQDLVCFSTLVGHEHTVSDLVNINETELIISVSRDKSLRVWDLSTGYCKKTFLDFHDDWIRCLDIKSNLLASAGNGREIKVIDINHQILKGEEGLDNLNIKFLSTFQGHDNIVETVCFIKSENKELDNILLSGSRDKLVIAWNYLSGEIIHKFSGHENWVKDITVIPNSNFFISVGEDKTIRIWDISKKRCVYIERSAHDHFLTCCDILPEYMVLLTASVDKNSKIWQITNTQMENILNTQSL